MPRLHGDWSGRSPVRRSMYLAGVRYSYLTKDFFAACGVGSNSITEISISTIAFLGRHGRAATCGT